MRWAFEIINIIGFIGIGICKKNHIIKKNYDFKFNDG